MLRQNRDTVDAAGLCRHLQQSLNTRRFIMRMQEKLKCGKEGRILAIHVSDKAIVYWLYTEIILICEKNKE